MKVDLLSFCWAAIPDLHFFSIFLLAKFGIRNILSFATCDARCILARARRIRADRVLCERAARAKTSRYLLAAIRDKFDYRCDIGGGRRCRLPRAALRSARQPSGGGGSGDDDGGDNEDHNAWAAG